MLPLIYMRKENVMGLYEERVKRLHDRVMANQKKAQVEKKTDKTDKKKPDTKGAK